MFLDTIVKETREGFKDARLGNEVVDVLLFAYDMVRFCERLLTKAFRPKRPAFSC